MNKSHVTPNRRSTLRALALIPVVALTMTACSGSSSGGSAGGSSQAITVGSSQGSLKSGLGSRAKSRNITLLLSQSAGDPFWGKIQLGAQDAAKLFNINLKVQSSEGDANKYNELIGTAVAAKPDALAVVVDDPKHYTENICNASKAGIPVMAYNITQSGPVADCMLGFVGQNFEEVGFLLGQRLLKDDPKIGKGSVVFTPVEFPDQVYAVQRNAGVQRALDSVGAKTDTLGTGIDAATTLDKQTQYLLGHKNIAAIVPLGGTPNGTVVQAMSDSGVNVPVVGFDLGEKVVAGIESGKILAAADQQPYIQGFQTIAQLALKLDFGLSPATINSGGSSLVDKTNVSVVKELSATIR
jgi:simple sugar transport system substrate-binding protein